MVAALIFSFRVMCSSQVPVLLYCGLILLQLMTGEEPGFLSVTEVFTGIIVV